jgi:hypothetical protein
MIPRHRLDERLGAREFSQGDAEVVGVVEGVHEVAVEGVDVGEFGEGVEGCLELFDELLAGELDFASVEVADAADFEAASSVGSAG